MKNFILFTMLLTVAACSSPEERAQQEAQREIAACSRAGYTAGTAAFDDCRQQIQSQEEQRKADRVSAVEGAPSSRSGSALPSGVSIPLP